MNMFYVCVIECACLACLSPCGCPRKALICLSASASAWAKSGCISLDPALHGSHRGSTLPHFPLSTYFPLSLCVDNLLCNLLIIMINAFRYVPCMPRLFLFVCLPTSLPILTRLAVLSYARRSLPMRRSLHACRAFRRLCPPPFCGLRGMPIRFDLIC